MQSQVSPIGFSGITIVVAVAMVVAVSFRSLFQPLNPHLHDPIVLVNLVSGLTYFDLISVSSFGRELATEKVREVVQAVLKEMTTMYS